MAKKTRLIDTLQEEELQEVKEEQEKENSNTIKKKQPWKELFREMGQRINKFLQRST